MKKVFLGTTVSIIGVMAPIVTVTSCKNLGVFEKRLDRKTVIRFGMRAEDMPSWDPIIKAFEKRLEDLHNKQPVKYPVAFKIKPVLVGDQKAFYSSQGGVMPNISLADPGVATFEKKHTSKWFKPLDPIEFLGTNNNDKYKLFEDQKGINFSAEGQDTSKSGFFESSFIPYYENTPTKPGEHKKLIALPYQYGPAVILLNKLFLDKEKTIKIVLPTNNGVKEVYDTKKKATIKNIREFIAGSADKDNEFVTIKDSKGQVIEAWSGYGPGNMYQRLASVGFSTLKDSAKSGGIYGWMKDIGIAFEVLASAPRENSDDYEGMGSLLKGGMVDDGVLQAQFTSGGYIDTENMKYIYNNQLGYFKNKGGYAAPPVVKSQAGEAEMMRDQQGMILLGKKWSRGFFTKGWKGCANNKSNCTGERSPEKAVVSLPVPYGSANMDGLGISKETKGFKLVASKMFIKLAMSMHKDDKGRPFSYLVSRDIDKQPDNPLAIKALPTSVAAKLYLKSLIDKSDVTDEYKKNYLASFGMGQKYKNGIIVGEADSYNGISGFFASASSEGFQQILSDKVTEQMKDWIKKSKDHLTMSNAKSLIQKGMTAAYLEFNMGK